LMLVAVSQAMGQLRDGVGLVAPRLVVTR